MCMKHDAYKIEVCNKHIFSFKKATKTIHLYVCFAFIYLFSVVIGIIQLINNNEKKLVDIIAAILTSYSIWERMRYEKKYAKSYKTMSYFIGILLNREFDACIFYKAFEANTIYIQRQYFCCCWLLLLISIIKPSNSLLFISFKLNLFGHLLWEKRINSHNTNIY